VPLIGGIVNRPRSKMMKKTASLGGLVALAGLAVAFGAPAADEPQRDTRSPSFEQLIPRWDLGDQWVVETTSRPIQMRGETDAQTVCRPIQWQFAVQRFEKALADDCYRVEVKCLLEGAPQPTTVLWVDKKSLALRKIETQLPVPDGFQTITQSYEFSSGQPSPVLGPLTALPVDLPLFLGDQTKGMQTFTYETHDGPAETKKVGELGFAYQIEQQVTSVSSEEVKGLLNETFTKGLTKQPVVEVQLKSGQQQVRQLWQPGLPWPVYSKNGSTECRLVKVIPAEQKPDEEREPEP
jgi:hypothetical protein